MNRESAPAPRKKSISIIEWIGSIILTMLPVINIVFFVLTLVFSRSRSKRNYAWAWIILIILAIGATITAFVLWGDCISDFLKDWYEETKTLIKDAPAATPAP